MKTYEKIQNWVQKRYGWQPKTCWIAHCKELAGLERHDAPNRIEGERANPCPKEERGAIFAAFRHYGML